MLQRILLFIFLAGMIIPTAGCRSNQIILTTVDNGKKLNVKAGEQIVVVLDGNPSTGYVWEAKDLDASMIQQVGETEFKSSNSSPGFAGAGGTLTLKFRALKTGTTSLTLVYHRPWETDEKPLSSFTAIITVK